MGNFNIFAFLDIKYLIKNSAIFHRKNTQTTAFHFIYIDASVFMQLFS